MSDHLYVICPTHVQMTWTVITMAKPTSAFFRAGPSLVPSPVTATTCLCSMMLLSMMPEHKKTKKIGHLACVCVVERVSVLVHVRYSPLTSVCLSVGDDRAKTRSLGQILSMRSCSIWGTDGEKPKEERVINLNSSLLSLDVTAVAGFNCTHRMEERKGTRSEAAS